MFRISLLVSALLILGVTAKPLDKPGEEASHEIIVSLDDSGKMLQGEEVEPPEDMDDLEYNIDPRMKIWKDLTDSSKLPQVSENDLEELYRLSLADAENESKEAFEEPEEDMDELYHQAKEQLAEYLAPLMTGDKAGVEERDAPFEQEAVETEQQPDVAGVQAMVRIHLQPEDDTDHLYHPDPRIFHQNGAFPKAAVAPVEYPSGMKHTQPEEDLDGHYHQ
ncbi:unnamed protein product [Ophioblennius macclurei]